ncbi:Soluble inorganic pyrophosphatase 6ic [Melia azedarach]|uniref:Soluble inorganic pyrophosphatase 6ic n=1 Tax=Melia azedarach TaxID=155640 RepID=A0ACC1Y0I8_MELAZ|nr:Soluble inorganic pyrophosphatase 6ic [Melia azedarach]
MAPTAAMLILSHHSKPSSSPPTFPSCSRPHAAAAAAASLMVKVSAVKWVQQGYTIFKGKSEDQESCFADSDPSGFALGKSFQEALEQSWW